MVAQELAISYPDHVRSLSLAATAASLSDEARDYMRSHGSAVSAQGMSAELPSLPLSLAERTVNLQPDLLERLTGTILGMEPEVYAAAWREIASFDASERLSSIRCPSLLLVGDEDRNTPSDASTLVAQAITGATMVVIDGASHMLPMEASERFNDELTSFLQVLDTRTTSDSAP